MTRVCLVGAEDATLPEDLLSYPTARDALDPYELEVPYENAIAVETISIGAAVSLLNDLDWYLVRLVDEALVLEPSVSESEWLSRELATEIRNETVAPEDTGTYLKIYGVERDGEARAGVEARADEDPGTSVEGDGERDADARPAAVDDDGDADTVSGGVPRLAEPLFVQRIDGEVPEYDLREVDETLLVRVTPEEFGGP